MKVLLCHAYYMQRGGEDCCFEEERDNLRAHGHEVVEFVRRNEEMTRLNPLAAAAVTLWNRRVAREMSDLLDRKRFDILHNTNTFPIISPAVCHIAHRRGVAVVQGMHNYRWLCANGYLMRGGKPCEDCLERRLPLPAIRHRCYRDSAAATAAVVAMQMAHHRFGSFSRKIDAFFAPSEFARQRFIAGGFPPERFHVKPNFVSVDPGVGRGDGGYVTFAGRLSPEKGLATLLEAWHADAQLPRLVIAGDGPLADLVRAAAACDPRIDWRGALPLADVHALMKSAAAFVIPSVWYETFGRTIVEAFACSTPVVASKLGAMAELVDDGRTGFHFRAGDPRDLATKVRRLLGLPLDELAAMRDAARQTYERRFTVAAHYASLVEIYQAALESARRRGEMREPSRGLRSSPLTPASEPAALN